MLALPGRTRKVPSRPLTGEAGVATKHGSKLRRAGAMTSFPRRVHTWWLRQQ